jgi:spore coat protein U-like protein
LALAGLSLTGLRVHAAAQTASIDVSITIEARCVVALAATPGRNAGVRQDLAVHCTDSTPYRIVFDAEQSRQSLSPRATPPAGAQLLEVVF